MKNVIHVLGVSGSGTTMARFCHSAFVRVATSVQTIYGNLTELCHSAFARVATPSAVNAVQVSLLCHSAFVRVATLQSMQTPQHRCTLPQRIRAGCDRDATLKDYFRQLCHSAFVRVATCCPPQARRSRCALPQRIRAGCDARAKHIEAIHGLCHSAFVRVATVTSKQLPLRRSFATAHSCGLRRDIMSKQDELLTLPQRIRAGCDSEGERQASTFGLCHSAFARVATFISLPPLLRRFFATAHSRGLRLAGCTNLRLRQFFATAHSRGLRLRRCRCCVVYRLLCHSAFARVATWH